MPQALKQVNAAEYNPDEYIKTNINGAQNIINVAISCKIKKVLAFIIDRQVTLLIYME